MADPYFSRGQERRQPWIHAALFALALAVSLALHGLLLLEWPALPGFRPVKVMPHEMARPLVMREVRVAPDPPSHDQPEAFRPEDPESFAAVEPMQRDLLEALREGAETLEFVPPAPAEASAPEEAPEDYSKLDFRQDILRVEEKKADDELAALPRMTMPEVERVAGAPDITLPADAIAIAEAAAAADGEGGGVFRSISALSGVAPGPVEVMEVVAGAGPTSAERLQEQVAILDERPAEVTDIAPIEQLLTVAVSVWRAEEEDALYFEASVSRAGPEGLPVLPKDVLLVQDCSESITRSKLDFFKEGIVAFLRTLTTADRVNIMRYSETPELCFTGWRPVTEDALQEAVRFTDSMRARGQTDLFSPLRKVLDIPRHPGRPMVVVLMTDGRPTMGTVDSSEIIARFSKLNKGEVSVFTVGAGDRVNTFLLDLLGHNNRGGAWIRPLREEIPEMVARAGRELSRPVLSGLEYRFSGDSEAEVYPATLTHLYLDRPLRLVGRCPLEQRTAVLQVVGDSGAQQRDMVFELDFDGADDGGEGIRREWVMQKIYKLINDHLAGGRADTLREIRDLSIRHNVPLPYGTDFPL